MKTITIDLPTAVVMHLIEAGTSTDNAIRSHPESAPYTAADPRYPGRQVDALCRAGLVRDIDGVAVLSRPCPFGRITVKD